MVYFIQSVGGGLIKIGHAADPGSRLYQIQLCCPIDLRIIGVMPGAEDEETQIHLRFMHLRRHGEWFEPDAELMDFVETSTGPWCGTRKRGWKRVTPKLTTVYAPREFIRSVERRAEQDSVSVSELAGRAIAMLAKSLEHTSPPLRASGRDPARRAGSDVPDSFRIAGTPEWRGWVNGLAEATGLTISELFRHALECYISTRATETSVLLSPCVC